MSTATRPAGASGSAARVKRRRDKLRAAGLRPVQIWLPDTRSPDFLEECDRQSRLIGDASNSAEDEAWFASGDRDGWTA